MKPAIPSLTGLRFVAALMVFLSHYPIPGAPGWLDQMTRSGYAGVTFFFVLSGFVLAYQYDDGFRLNPQRQLGPYLVARFARIYPLYLVTMLYVWWSLDQPPALWPYLLTLQTWSPDLRVAFGLNGPGWSIGVEVFLYAAFPAIILGLNRSGAFRSSLRMGGMIAAIVTMMLLLATGFTLWGGPALDIGSPNSAHRWLYRMPVSRLFDFALGILAARYVAQTRPGVATMRIWNMLSATALLTIVLLLASRWHYYTAFSWDVSFAVPIVVIIVGLSLGACRWLAWPLSLPAMLTLGEISYAFYLVHVPARPLLGMLGATVAGAFVGYALFLAVVIGLAFAAYALIERPARRSLKSLAHALRAHEPVAERS